MADNALDRTPMPSSGDDTGTDLTPEPAAIDAGDDPELKRLLDDRKRLTAKIRAKKGKLKGQATKRENRKKVLAGAAVLSEADGDAEVRAWLLKLLNRFLTRPDERALFNLPTLASDKPGPEPLEAWPPGGELASLDTATAPH